MRPHEVYSGTYATGHIILKHFVFSLFHLSTVNRYNIFRRLLQDVARKLVIKLHNSWHVIEMAVRNGPLLDREVHVVEVREILLEVAILFDEGNEHLVLG